MEHKKISEKVCGSRSYSPTVIDLLELLRVGRGGYRISCSAPSVSLRTGPILPAFYFTLIPVAVVVSLGAAHK
jgi:hypothetical protein